MVLLALISDADEVDISFPAADGGNRYTYYCGLEQPDGWAQALDYEDLKEMGQSPQGVRELLDYLDVEEAEGTGAELPEGFLEYSDRTMP